LRRRALNLGITAGDPAGIGPEVALRAINALRDETIIPILIGRKTVLEKNHPDIFTGYEMSLPDSGSPNNAGRKYLHDVQLDLKVPLPGAGCADTGREALACVDAAIGLWKAGSIDAVVTGPVSKGFIEKSGVHFTGHTEYIAEKIGGGDPLMMMFSEKYRVLLASTHVPVSDIMRHVDRDRLLRVMRAGYESIRSIDGGSARLAITGLDPHCGDDGAIGTFDRDVTVPAVAAARAEGVPVEGPFAADTLFIPSAWERYNLVIAHYHDQGLIPFKMLAFDRGVNVTLGLPIVRTSVDHGTAFDIAGKNIAGWNSMLEAILLARKLAEMQGR
jgi:4-hydroxythreonine-4-phosphate dehydrogenase